MTERFENGYRGLTAVVTGGGTGMGRELVLQLTAQGCDVATCDVMADTLTETTALCADHPGDVADHVGHRQEILAVAALLDDAGLDADEFTQGHQGRAGNRSRRPGTGERG